MTELTDSTDAVPELSAAFLMNVDKTVTWWKNALEGKALNTAGCDEIDIVMTLVKPQPVKENDPRLEKFSTELKRLILESAEYFPVVHIYLYVDYDPCRELRAALAAAGIPAMNLPIKTTTFTSEQSVSVKNGYGRPYVAL